MKSVSDTIRHWRIFGKKKFNSVLWGALLHIIYYLMGVLNTPAITDTDADLLRI